MLFYRKVNSQCFIVLALDDFRLGLQHWRTLLMLFCVACLANIPETRSSYVQKVDDGIDTLNKTALREKAHEMFMHGYTSYMLHAFPHDELMPISCRGRQRGVTPSRGDVDDALGNFSLTLVDTLDTLVVVGEFDEFERAVRLVADTVRFDSDLIVSVFETNIRMIGGLISAHLMSLLVKQKTDSSRFLWYSDQLLRMATDLADRLLPAFNTTSGVPHSRINLKHGLVPNLRRQQDTCTACGGTMILEWAALSRLTGNPIYEDKARKAMDFLWAQRHKASDLMGTVLNVNSGDWIRRDSGIGAGIDSYYEYTLKTYILLGEEDYLHRFNKHYESIMRYLNKGPLFIDVQMHKPQIASRSYMDALMAFWPGVQVLKGDLRSAIEMHEMLYNVVKRHKFLPDAFTHDLQVHWATHPLRPEFIESTYFLYRATRDPHYLEVAKQVMESLEQNVKVRCGFASIKDVQTLEHEDQMESFVLAETFKYLYMIFADPNELPFHPDNYVLTTEAHFLPLTIGEMTADDGDRLPRRILIDPDEIIAHEAAQRPRFESACPNIVTEDQGLAKLLQSPDRLIIFGNQIREAVSKVLDSVSLLADHQSIDGKETCAADDDDRLRAWSFNPTNPAYLAELKRMGIQVDVEQSGFVKMLYTAQTAQNAKFAVHGLQFIREMSTFLKEQQESLDQIERGVLQVISSPHYGLFSLIVAPAQFGTRLDAKGQFAGEVALADPLKACTPLQNGRELNGKVVVVRRGECMFEQKARHAQRAGALSLVVIDNQKGTSADSVPTFIMSEANDEDNEPIYIPSVFLFHTEGQLLLDQLFYYPKMVVRLAAHTLSPVYCFEQFLYRNPTFLSQQFPIANQFIVVAADKLTLRLNFLFGGVDVHSVPEQKQAMVERNVEWIEYGLHFPNELHSDGAGGELHRKFTFLGHVRALAYSLLGYPNTLSSIDMLELRQLVKHLRIDGNLFEEKTKRREKSMLPVPNLLASKISVRSIICRFQGAPGQFSCSEFPFLSQKAI